MRWLAKFRSTKRNAATRAADSDIAAVLKFGSPIN